MLLLVCQKKDFTLEIVRVRIDPIGCLRLTERASLNLTTRENRNNADAPSRDHRNAEDQSEGVSERLLLQWHSPPEDPA